MHFCKELSLLPLMLWRFTIFIHTLRLKWLKVCYVNMRVHRNYVCVNMLACTVCTVCVCGVCLH